MVLTILLAALLAPMPNLQGLKDLTTAHAVIEQVKVTIVAKPELAPELTKWLAIETKHVEDEEAFRVNIALPICQDTWLIEQARATISRERRNPGGVHDLRVLHDAGEDIQRASEDMKARTPAYLAFRKHAFTKWESEGVCVAEVNKQRQ